MGIVVIGTVFLDIKGFPYDKYSPTGRNAGIVETVHGGVGRNVAEDIANIGLEPILLSLVDDTAGGEEVLHRLQKHNVNTDYIRALPDGMGIWLAVFDNNGELAGSISKRPEMDSLLDVIHEKGDVIFSNADSIIIEIDLGEDIANAVFEYAEKYNKKVFALVSNMIIAAQNRDIFRKTSGFICNEEEAEILFADGFDNIALEEMPLELFKRIQNACIPSMVVTLGSRGSVYASADGSYGYCPAEKVKVYDTTGAGDAFCAGLAIGMTYGKSIGESAVIGTRLASSVIMRSENTCPIFLPQEFGISI